jgi:LSU ribosomal protein L5P
MAAVVGYKPRLQVKYEQEVVKKLMERFGYKSPMQVPRIKKIVINMGVGKATEDIKLLDRAVEDLTALQAKNL